MSLFKNVLVVEDLSTTQHVFFVIFLLAVYLHGLFLASFFIGYISVEDYGTRRKIRNIWKIIFTFLVYEIFVYLVFKFLGSPSGGSWPYFLETSKSILGMTLIEFVLLVLMGISYSIKLRTEQHVEDPYGDFGEGV